MRSRQEIKEMAKQAFAAQRGTAILALFLAMLFIAGYSVISTVPSIISNIMIYTHGYYNQAARILATVGGVLGLLAIPISLITIVLNVNLCGTFTKVFYGQPITSTEPYSEIKVNFGRKLGGSLWAALWVYLWSIVGMFTLFIPTIIKALSYSMSPYILANNPNVTATNALTLSKRMTSGHKGKIFVLYLSFIGWQLLNGLTVGILGIFYVNPYMYTTFAGFFVELRNLAVANGTIHTVELDGYPQQFSSNQQFGQPPGMPPPQYPQYPPVPPQQDYSTQYPPVPPPPPLQPPQHYSHHPDIPPPPPPISQQRIDPMQIQQPPLPEAPPIPQVPQVEAQMPMPVYPVEPEPPEPPEPTDEQPPNNDE